jgi:hypothetical protein
MSSVKQKTETCPQEKILVVVLRLWAVVLLLAFPMMLLPVEWMAATHRRLGLGEFPASPLVDYLTRSISFLYGFHGGLLLVVANDIRRYRGMVLYIVVMGLVFGASMIAVDLHAGVPLRWTFCEGPSIIITSVIVGVLLRAVPRNGKVGYRN